VSNKYKEFLKIRKQPDQILVVYAYNTFWEAEIERIMV
jgi:hypothetical protein